MSCFKLEMSCVNVFMHVFTCYYCTDWVSNLISFYNDNKHPYLLFTSIIDEK